MKTFHIIAGVLALASGAVALCAAKGSPLHRRSGTVFFYSMLATCLGGLVMAIGRGVAPAINIPAALLTAYLVITARTTVRPLADNARWLERGATAVALATGLVCLGLGFEAVAAGGRRSGMAFPFFLFGAVGTLAAALDIRMMRAGGLQGAARLARHLWRMCFALFIAAMSFFLGQADEFPAWLRIRPLLALPVLAVLVSMCYWLWCVRTGRSVHHVPSVRRRRGSSARDGGMSQTALSRVAHGPPSSP